MMLLTAYEAADGAPDRQAAPARARLDVVLGAILAALAGGYGFAAIRLGDGEGALLGFDGAAFDAAGLDETAFDQTGMAARLGPDLAGALAIWFGPGAVACGDLVAMREGLMGAIGAADVLGLPRPAQCAMSGRYRAVMPGVVRALARRGGAGQGWPQVSDAALHFYLQWSGGLGLALRAARTVWLVGCRDVGAGLADALGLADVRWIAVRGEAAFAGSVAQAHWPDGFAATLAALGRAGPGDLVLVGAGVLGKAYCAAAKAAGAVAVDIGSVFDGWAQIASRGALTGAAHFSIAHLRDVPCGAAAARARLAAMIGLTHIRDGQF